MLVSGLMAEMEEVLPLGAAVIFLLIERPFMQLGMRVTAFHSRITRAIHTVGLLAGRLSCWLRGGSWLLGAPTGEMPPGLEAF